MDIRPYRKADERAVVALWRDSGLYLAVAPDCRRQGFGLRMMDAAEGRLAAMGCPKINLQIRRSNTQAVDFYRSIGFVEDATISMGKRLVDD